MRTAYALRWTAASLVLALAGCTAIEDPSTLASTVKKQDSCLVAEPIAFVPVPGSSTALQATIVGNSTAMPNQPELCADLGFPIHRPTYYAFTVGESSALYVDTVGSEIDTVVGLLESGCSGPPGACSDDACGGTRSQLVRYLAPRDANGAPITYRLVVGGRAAEDRGNFVVNVRLYPIPQPPLGEIPHGSFDLFGTLSIPGSNMGACNRSFGLAWYWYTSCPDVPGRLIASTTNADTEFEATLSLVDLDDGLEICCDADRSGTNVACMGDGLQEFPRQAAIDVTDEPEAAFHILKVGAVGGMSVPPGQFHVVGWRP